MTEGRKESLEPGRVRTRALRERLTFKGELVLAGLPTLTVLLVFALVEVLSQQRLLFASLAASAFLIYLDPEHGTNSVRTLVVSQQSAALIGLLTYMLIPSVYVSGAVAMVAIIVLMIALDIVHPPAVSTAISFAFRTGDASNILVFGLALAITAMLVLLEGLTLWLLRRLSRSAAFRAASRSAQSRTSRRMT